MFLGSTVKFKLSRAKKLLIGDLDLTVIDALLDLFGSAAINGAADRVGGTKDFEDSSDEFLGLGLLAHLTSDVEDGGEGQVTTVGDVLDLLAVTEGLLEGLDDQGGGVGDNENLFLMAKQTKMNDLNFGIEIHCDSNYDRK